MTTTDLRAAGRDSAPVALTTLQFGAGGLLDWRPVDGDEFAVHLIRVAASGGTPGPTLCNIDRFAPESAGWSIAGGITGPGIVHTPCPGCLEAACTEFGGVPIARRAIGSAEMTAARAADVKATLECAAELGLPPFPAQWLAAHRLGKDLALAEQLLAGVALCASTS